MNAHSYQILKNKVIINIHDTICENSAEIINSRLFREILDMAVFELQERRSYLLEIFEGAEVNDSALRKLTKCLTTLATLNEEGSTASQDDLKLCEGFLKNKELFNEFVEYLYNFWRGFDRFIICDSMGRNWDKRPYRTFNATIGHLTNLIRGLYRDIQESITGDHPRIYRQVTAGAEMAVISVSQSVPFYNEKYEVLNNIPMIRQVLLNPPLILNPPMNKRKGKFVRIDRNPIDFLKWEPADWLCYPAKVGPLLILVYIHKSFIELGLSLCNLFKLADDNDLMQKPDAVYFFGVPDGSLDSLAEIPTVFYDDEQNNMLVAAAPSRDEFGYFGYLKKMVLTLHNIIMMKRDLMPFHGALVRIVLKGNKSRTVLFIGDTGAGKSETLEAFREIGQGQIQDMFIIADDMGSLKIDEKGDIIGYGTEIGAFLRLDDLKPGYALGQIDRAIIMSASQVNARIILPVTSYETLMKGHKIDFILYANNYDEVDEDHPIVERIENKDDAFRIFREGTVMSKGTTATTGLVHVYFTNIFGPVQYKDLHEKIARRYFDAFFAKGIYVGQMRTRLGLKGFEQNGPVESAQELLNLINKSA